MTRSRCLETRLNNYQFPMNTKQIQLQPGNTRNRSKEGNGDREGIEHGCGACILEILRSCIQHVSSTDCCFLFWIREKPNNVSSEEGVAHNTGVI